MAISDGAKFNDPLVIFTSEIASAIPRLGDSLAMTDFHGIVISQSGEILVSGLKFEFKNLNCIWLIVIYEIIQL